MIPRYRSWKFLRRIYDNIGTNNTYITRTSIAPGIPWYTPDRLTSTTSESRHTHTRTCCYMYRNLFFTDRMCFYSDAIRRFTTKRLGSDWIPLYVASLFSQACTDHRTETLAAFFIHVPRLNRKTPLIYVCVIKWHLLPFPVSSGRARVWVCFLFCPSIIVTSDIYSWRSINPPGCVMVLCCTMGVLKKKENKKNTKRYNTHNRCDVAVRVFFIFGLLYFMRKTLVFDFK